MRDSIAESSVQGLQNLVSNQVAELQSQGQLTGAALAQMYQSVSNALNEGSSEEEKSARKEVSVHGILYVNCSAIGTQPVGA